MTLPKVADTFYSTLPIAKLGGLVAFLAVFVPDISIGGVLKSHFRMVTPLTAIFVFAWAWLSFVSAYVPEPYLDEIFHIPQAQKYCEGKWFEWDDKITTPPGLYGITILALDARLLMSNLGCSVFNLRSVNVWCITLLAYMAAICRCQIEVNLSQSRGQSKVKPVSIYSLHTGFNIALFPVLMFFSAFYYTDILSTLAVLGAYSNHLVRVRRPRSSIGSDILTLMLGLFALTMRQTNVFWVVVYMGGLEAVHAVKTVAAKLPKQRISGPMKTVIWRYCFNSSLGDIHDPPFSKAWPDDLVFTAVSLAVAVVSNPMTVAKQVWPHIATMAAFASFVLWNGGVVLGDKSNHVATVHLAQMLYIWPLFAFFSGPMLLPAAISVLKGTISLLRRLIARPTNKGYSTAHATGALTSEEPVFKRVKHNYVNFSGSAVVKQSFGSPPRYTLSGAPRWRVLIYVATLVLGPMVAFAVVKYNTIIHPFTLADNRHYMFYVFRYTIMRPGLFRFYLIGPYLVSAVLVLASLTVGDQTMPTVHMQFFNHPFIQPPMTDAPPQVPGPSRRKAKAGGRIKKKPKIKREAPYVLASLGADASASSTIPLTTVLLLMLATTLSLITAPLVEPRYFIIPWVMWRLQVPAWAPAWATGGSRSNPRRFFIVHLAMTLGRMVDLRLVLETIWMMLINWVTMRMFITKPFYWTAEDGTLLDEGRAQRFMW